MTIDPANLSAQLRYRAAGNPPSTVADSAISNCYPGLEYDFRNVFRRIFEGIVLHEADNYVVDAAEGFKHLINHRLLKVDGQQTGVELIGPQMPQGDSANLSNASNPNGVTALEWSNVLADIIASKAGQLVDCEFTPRDAPDPVRDVRNVRRERLRVRSFFARSGATRDRLAVINPDLVEPGELTQSLCSPWQNDYRECACYYWAASRPDYVNVELNERGVSTGKNWLDRSPQSKNYVPDDFRDQRLFSYEELFREWQRLLRFVIQGREKQ
jgi:hypothetical protein